MEPIEEETGAHGHLEHSQCDSNSNLTGSFEKKAVAPSLGLCLKSTRHCLTDVDGGMQVLDPAKSQGSGEKEKKSLHEVSNGMIQPNIPTQRSRSVNYEIYNRKDKFDCPQNTHLVNKKEFVYSVNYPHAPKLDLSSIC